MIIYSVTLSLDPAIEQDWLAWMQASHIPQVMATVCFVAYRLQRILTEAEPGAITYNMQYSLQTMELYMAYQTNHAPALQAETAARYPGQYAAFRTLLEVLAAGDSTGPQSLEV